MRPRRQRFRSGLAAIRASTIGELRAHPARAVGISALCLTLLALIATTTLPAALARHAPELALALNPDQPEALMRLARQARAELRALSGSSDRDLPEEANAGKPDGADADAAEPDEPDANAPPADAAADETAPVLPAPSAAPPADLPATVPTSRQQALLREEIRTLALRLEQVDPLNAAAFSLLAEVTDDEATRRSLMQEAGKRSRRDTAANIWLFQDSLANGRFETALERADILMRVEPGLRDGLLAILGGFAEDPEHRSELLAWLARSPDWREGFFRNLTRSITQADTPFLMMQQLAERGAPPSHREISRYISFLMAREVPDYAYSVWTQTLSPEALARLGFLNNPGFEESATGGPFDWKVAAAYNAIGEIVPLPDDRTRRAFHVTLGPGRVRFPELSQMLVLPPGPYRLEGEFRGTVIGRRGLVWRMQCLYKPNPPLATSEPLIGKAPEWRLFSFTFNIPDTAACRAQSLRLLHDARSASEELVSGDAWLGGLAIYRVPDPEE